MSLDDLLSPPEVVFVGARRPITQRRVVHRLVDKELTPRQLAQQRYRASAKGKAADARSKAVQRKKPGFRAAETARARAWYEANIVLRRVYQRTRSRRLYVKRPVGPGQAHIKIIHTCECGRQVRGNAIASHRKHCAQSAP